MYHCKPELSSLSSVTGEESCFIPPAEEGGSRGWSGLPLTTSCLPHKMADVTLCV